MDGFFILSGSPSRVVGLKNGMAPTSIHSSTHHLYLHFTKYLICFLLSKLMENTWFVSSLPSSPFTLLPGHVSGLPCKWRLEQSPSRLPESRLFCTEWVTAWGTQVGPWVSLRLSHWGPCTGRQHRSEALPADSLSVAAPEPGSALCPGPANGPPFQPVVPIPPSPGCP